MQTWEFSDIAGNPGAVIESVAKEFGLSLGQSTLKKFPGSTHWHLKMPGRVGVVEATWCPKEKRFWLSVHENRKADWQQDVFDLLTARLSKAT